MDVLSDVLQHLRLESAVLARPRTFAPWGLSMAAGEDAPFHLILGGGAWLRLENGAEPLELRAGDLVLLPQGTAHSLADAADSPLQPSEPLYAGKRPEDITALRVGGNGRETLVVSGRFRFARHGVHPLLSQLPPLVLVRAGQGWRGQWLEHSVHLLSAELASARPGSQAVVGRLLEVLFLQALRCYVEDGHAGAVGWLQGLRDERVARALACIHGDPRVAWSTARLAEQAGMGRTPFAALFVRLVGEPPPNYLTRWRIQTPLAALRSNATSLAQVAAAVGYPSTDAFTRIFKRMVGMPPAEYRRASHAGREPLLQVERDPSRPGALLAAAQSESA